MDAEETKAPSHRRSRFVGRDEFARNSEITAVVDLAAFRADQDDAVNQNPRSLDADD